MVERSKCMNVPEIRFKEFCDYYSDILLEKCLSVSNKKNNKLEYKKEDALSVSDEFGVVNQIEHLGRSIIRKSKFPQNPKRSVRFSGKRTKRSVQKRKARNTQKAETKVL